MTLDDTVDAQLLAPWRETASTLLVAAIQSFWQQFVDFLQCCPLWVHARKKDTTAAVAPSRWIPTSPLPVSLAGCSIRSSAVGGEQKNEKSTFIGAQGLSTGVCSVSVQVGRECVVKRQVRHFTVRICAL